jgi:hypothetical protein
LYKLRTTVIGPLLLGCGRLVDDAIDPKQTLRCIIRDPNLTWREEFPTSAPKERCSIFVPGREIVRARLSFFLVSQFWSKQNAAIFAQTWPARCGRLSLNRGMDGKNTSAIYRCREADAGWRKLASVSHFAGISSNDMAAFD